MRTRTKQVCARCYDTMWTLAAGAVCAVGLLVAVRTSGPVVAASIFVTTAILEAILVLPLLTELHWRIRPVLVGAPVCGGIMVVTVGLLLALGPAATVVVAVLLLTSPFTRDGVRRVLSRRPGRPAPVTALGAMPSAPSQAPRALPDDPGFTIPDQMTVADLCQAWRSSYVALERVTSPESRLRVVMMRAIYLDELERRAAPAMQAWLHSGARAAGDPSRWVTPKEFIDLRPRLH